MKTARLYISVVALLPVALMPLASQAQKASTQAIFAKAFNAYAAFDCATALSLFRQGLQKSNDARAWYYVGNCERWRGERMASDAAYANGLKSAERGSDIEARLTSAKASLPAAWDPQLQTKMFYEKVRQANVDLLPSGYSISVDPRLFPVHPEYSFNISMNLGQRGPDSNGIRKYADVTGPGVYSWIADFKYNRKLKKYTKGEKLTDANGFEYTRTGLLFLGNVAAQPDHGWPNGYVKYEHVVEFGIGVTENPDYTSSETRCQFNAPSDDSTQFHQDRATLIARCVHKSNNDTYTDLTDIPLPWDLAKWDTTGNQ